MKILVIDDEPRLVEVLTVSFQFQWQDATVLAAGDGEEGLELLYEHNPDVVVLDVGLPGMSGLDVLRDLRRTSDVPVIILSAAGDETDQVRGLELGADGYLVKPFSSLALMAHIKALLRRAELAPPTDALPDFVAGDLAVHFQTHQVTLRGQDVKLTAVEYKLLYHLVRNAGRLMPHKALLDRVWGKEYDATEHYLRVFISRLRAKLETTGRAPLITTERGVGYRFIRPPSEISSQV
jgi:two-component system KDP operon response regulator KdpE